MLETYGRDAEGDLVGVGSHAENNMVHAMQQRTSRV